MAKAVRRYAPEHGQPGGYGHVLSGLLSGTRAAAPLAPCVCDERSVRSPWPCSVTCLASPGVLVADKADKPSARRGRERLSRYGRWPRRHWPTGEQAGLRHENRNRRPLAGAGELARRLCRFAVDEMALSGCALVLMSGAESAAALAVGVQAEFSLPLTVGTRGIGTLDLCRDRTGMLSDEHLADAMVAADIARDAVLYQPYAPGGPALTELLATAGTDRIVIHQATGIIAAQLDDTTANALARLRAAAFASGRSMYDIARDVVERRVRFDE